MRVTDVSLRCSRLISPSSIFSFQICRASVSPYYFTSGPSRHISEESHQRGAVPRFVHISPYPDVLADINPLLPGAQLMSNLSELFMRSAPTSAALHQSEAWARQALSLLQKTQGNASQSDDVRVCEEALAVVLFNLGSLREVCNLPFPFAYARVTQD